MLYMGSDERNCSNCHKIKGIECFETAGTVFRTCNICRDRARRLRRDRSPTWTASVSLSSAASEPTPNEMNELAQSISALFMSSSSSASASASYFVAEPEPEPEPSLRKKVRGLADI